MARPNDQRHVVLRALYDAHFERLLAFARRRTDQLSDAEDVVAETFVVAWRRLDALPTPEEQRLPWLYGIARRVLANHRRAVQRRLRLLDRLRSTAGRGDRQGLPTRDALEALARLAPGDQELLRLVAWEGLTHAEIALVLGTSANAVAIRVHRARQRLAREMKGSTTARTFREWKGSAELRRAARRPDD